MISSAYPMSFDTAFGLNAFSRSVQDPETLPFCDFCFSRTASVPLRSPQRHNQESGSLCNSMPEMYSTFLPFSEQANLDLPVDKGICILLRILPIRKNRFMRLSGMNRQTAAAMRWRTRSSRSGKGSGIIRQGMILSRRSLDLAINSMQGKKKRHETGTCLSI